MADKRGRGGYSYYSLTLSNMPLEEGHEWAHGGGPRERRALGSGNSLVGVVGGRYLAIGVLHVVVPCQGQTAPGLLR